MPRFEFTKDHMSSLKRSQRVGSLSTLSLLKVMRTCPSWIQQHPHGVILRHLLNMINSFLCSSTNYFENRLLLNDLIIIRRDDEEAELDIKRALERQGEAHINVEFDCETTQSPGPPYLQIDVQDVSNLRFGQSTYAWKDKEIIFPMPSVSWSTKIGVGHNR